MKQPVEGRCPVCGAAVQENARFCLHCMTSFDEKTAVAAVKPKKRAAGKRAALLLGAMLLLGAGLLAFFLLRDRPSADPPAGEGTETKAALPALTPLADIEAFRLAAALASERLGCEDLWDPGALQDVMYDRETDTEKYTAPISLPGARLDLFLRRDGRVATLILSDVPAEALPDAKLLCAVAHVALTNYYSDILQILTDEDTYPRKRSKAPFEEFFAEMTGRLERYQAALAAGDAFATRYLLISDDRGDDALTVYFETAHTHGEETRYDLILRFDYYSNSEVNVGGAGA